MQEKLSSSALASSSHTLQHQIKPLSKTSKGIAKICTLTLCYVVLNEDFNFKEKIYHNMLFSSLPKSGRMT